MSWAQHVAYLSSVFVDVFIVGKCIFFKALDQTYLVVTLPHLSLTLDFNPLFHCLDTVLSLYSVCVN